MRALLVVNPRATGASPHTTDVIVQALSHELDLQVELTTHRGHGTVLGNRALDERFDAVIALGGDGVVNEVLNGILRDGTGTQVPALGAIPGGSANVFSRALRIPNDPVEATGLLLRSVREGRFRRIGVGHVRTDETERWFTVNAGLGLDARVIESMEDQRQAGKRATPLRYAAITLREYLRYRGAAEMTLSSDDDEKSEGWRVIVVQNTSPWTYIGSLPVDPCPGASFDTGLDAFAMKAMDPVTTSLAARWMLAPTLGRDRRFAPRTHMWHDQSALHVTCAAPVALQVDGEALGSRTNVKFTAHPEALMVMG